MSANRGDTKVIARIFGGLGNQLFCYAAARRLSLVNGAELALDHVSGFIRDRIYNRTYQLDHFNILCRKASPGERLEPFSLVRRYAKRRWYRNVPFEKRQYIVQEGPDYDPRLLQVRPKGALYLEGYWQSASYFSDVETTIRDDLRIQPPTDAANQTTAGCIQDTLSVAVHIRYFDTDGKRGVSNASADYYSRAISEMDKLANGAHYFLFSDRPETAHGLISLPAERITLISHNRGDENAYADLWLMTQCKHFIIANSTFSWWAAWLSQTPNKHVIAPGFVKRTDQMSWGFNGLIPKEWHTL